MIDFRYHLVSIIAVFLALAVGIVVGVEVHPLAVKALQTSENLLKQEINKVTNQGKTLQNENSLGQSFAQAAAPRLLGGLLPGQKVVLVTTSDADSSVVSGVTTALSQAGAKVTGQVQLSQSFFDTGGATRQLLIQLADRLAPAVGVKVSTQPAIPQIAGQEAAAQVIAAGIVGKAVPTAGQAAVPTAAQAQTVLSGFSQANFLQVIGGSAAFQPGTMAVVVIPSSPVTPANDGDPSIQGLVAVASQLAHDSDGMVIAGNLSGAGPGSAIDAVVSNGDPLSTVDNADSETGQIIVVQALAKLLEGHKPQAYGVLVGNAPSPVPVPTPSVSTSVPPARRPK